MCQIYYFVLAIIQIIGDGGRQGMGKAVMGGPGEEYFAKCIFMPLQERSNKLGWVHWYVMQRRKKIMAA